MDMRRIHDSLIRSFWQIIMFDGFRSDCFFCQERYRRAEEVVKECPFFGVEIIEQGYDLGVV